MTGETTRRFRGESSIRMRVGFRRRKWLRGERVQKLRWTEGDVDAGVSISGVITGVELSLNDMKSRRLRL